jgi:hypothetical protein
VCCRLYPFIFWIIIKEGPGNFSGGHSPHWVNHAYLCLYCIVYLLVFYFHICFILLLHDPIFLTTLSILIYGMRVFPMFNTTTIWLSIAPPTIDPFRWGWDSNPWVPLMLHYLLEPHRKILPMFSLRPTKPPDSLSGFITSTNRSMRFCRKPMLSTSNTMINTGYCISFRWEIRSGYICRKNTL